MPGDEIGGQPVIRKTDDFETIRRLALEAGLEDGTFENIISAVGFFIGNQMMGTVALKKDGDRYSIEWLSVSESLRGKGIGGMLVSRIESEAKARGASTLWALARAPKFFEKIGFRMTSLDEAGGPSMSNCLLCRQYQKNCFPSIVSKNI
ncbi:MAG: GNAT family N-acetyltransferase [Candidatus Thermoplasmatota archaeon]|nr:GNAT family N-acetyltransferase [Candidatus Thermoplasmatota archaeon]